MNEALVIETLTLIGASALSIALLSRIGLPAMLGYLFAGIVIGPLGLGLVAATDGPRFLAQLGLVLLLFMVGLEFSWVEIWAARRAVFIGGAVHFALSTVAATLVAGLFGMSLTAALLTGAAVAMSSTGLTLKQLQEQRELARPHGRLTMGILLLQDVATLPLLVIIDAGASTGTIDFLKTCRQLLIAGSSLGALLWVGRPALRSALTWIGQRKSVDLFLLCAMLLALGTAYIAERLGAAATIGAFLAGVVVGESDLRHRISEHLKPFRDMLLGLFFVTVGMQVDPKAIVASPLQAILWLVVLVVIKATLGLVAGRAAGYDVLTAMRASVALAHASELSLLIITQGMGAALIPTHTAQSILVATALSMGLAPVFIQHNRLIATRVLRTLTWRSSRQVLDRPTAQRRRAHR